MLLKDKLKTIERAVDRFLVKATQPRVNEPLQRLQGTMRYVQFNKLWDDAIHSQAQTIANRYANHGEDKLRSTHPQQEIYVRQWVRRNFPKLSDVIDQSELDEFFLYFFNWWVKDAYRRQIFRKADATFTLSNPRYIQALQDRSNYLLNQSTIDETSRERIISIIDDGLNDGLTNAEVADLIESEFEDISASRADMIARTESANAAGQANYATLVENGIQTHHWVTAGDNPCIICETNEDAGDIPIDQEFPSGDLTIPAHPNCECYTESSDTGTEIPDEELWSGQ